MQFTQRSGVTLISLRVAVLAALAVAQLAAPAPMAWAAPTPSTTITTPTTVMLGEPVTFTVSFANTGGVGEVGYGPYLNVELPIEGADGAGAATDDGLSFTSASYLGSTLTPKIAPFLCTGTYTHPLTGLTTACTSGKRRFCSRAQMKEKLYPRAAARSLWVMPTRLRRFLSKSPKVVGGNKGIMERLCSGEDLGRKQFFLPAANAAGASSGISILASNSIF